MTGWKYYTFIKRFLKERFNLITEKDDDLQTIESIRKGVEFKGFNLWVLICAIFIASLGLNTNSTAVIIGAMLISPLMGPIMGLGLGVGIYDFDLIKRSFKNLLVASIIGMITSAIYFYISPISEARSELLARTSPTIYDVLIAFFGGMAGIIAASNKEKGNVIPGVAIATALMPPLCTAGYGIASGNLSFFLGACYLYFINSVFISFATVIGTRIFKFPKTRYVDAVQEKKVTGYITVIIVITLIPSIFFGYKILKENYFRTNAERFIASEFNFYNTQIISKTFNPDKKEIGILLIGNKVPQDSIDHLRTKLPGYNLNDVTLSVKQGFTQTTVDEKKIKSDLLQEFYKNSEEVITDKDKTITRLRQELQVFNDITKTKSEIISEMKILFPSIEDATISFAPRVHIENMKTDTVLIALLNVKRLPSKNEQKKLEEWLGTRFSSKDVKVVYE